MIIIYKGLTRLARWFEYLGSLVLSVFFQLKLETLKWKVLEYREARLKTSQPGRYVLWIEKNIWRITENWPGQICRWNTEDNLQAQQTGCEFSWIGDRVRKRDFQQNPNWDLNNPSTFLKKRKDFWWEMGKESLTCWRLRWEWQLTWKKNLCPYMAS